VCNVFDPRTSFEWLNTTAILRHRDVVRLSLGRIPLGPNALRYADRVLAILRTGGVPDDLAVAGEQLLISIVAGFATQRAHS
jgi:TetR/AcrR family tetracycline transcriptional repressor